MFYWVGASIAAGVAGGLRLSTAEGIRFATFCY